MLDSRIRIILSIILIFILTILVIVIAIISPILSIDNTLQRINRHLPHLNLLGFLVLHANPLLLELIQFLEQVLQLGQRQVFEVVGLDVVEDDQSIFLRVVFKGEAD